MILVDKEKTELHHTKKNNDASWLLYRLNGSRIGVVSNEGRSDNSIAVAVKKIETENI